jgi:crossover junction endodeoxyribonuclease RuvC
MKVLSIDPGFERLGIAILEKKEKENEVLLFSECFKTKTSQTHSQRLFLIGQEIEKIILKYKPEFLSIEKLFFNTNQKTIIGVAEARGVVLYEANKNNLEVFEFTPLEVKVAVTGYGRSEKKQVIDMTSRILKLKTNLKKSDDEFDAIALGLTFFACYRKKN